MVVNSMAEVASFFGISSTTIYSSWKVRGMPGSDGAYDLGEIARWYVKWQPKQGGDSGGDKTKTELECEKLEIENERRRLKLEMERGKLVLREATILEQEHVNHRIRSRLEAIPEELAASLPPELRADYLGDAKQKISLVLRELESYADRST